MTRKISKGKEVLFTVITWAVILWGINAVCGLIVQNRYIAADMVDEKAAETSYGYFIPNQEKIILFPGLKEYKVTVNNLGLRTTGYKKNLTVDDLNGKYRILTIGDSMTFGLFVDDKDSYPYRLQQLLKKKGKDAVVLNAGVGATTLSDYLYHLKKKGLALKPDLVAISFCENDLNGLDEAPYYERVKKKSAFDLARTVKLAKFMRVFRKWELARRYRHWIDKKDDPRVQRALREKSEDIGEILYVAEHECGMLAMDPHNPQLAEKWKAYLKYLDETIRLLQEQNIDILFVFYPNILNVFERAKGDYHDILIPYLESKGVPYLDLRPAFRARKHEALELYNSLPRDFHLSGKGNQIVAELFYEKIKDKF